MYIFLWPTALRASSLPRLHHHSGITRQISLMQRPLPDNTQHSQETNIRTTGGNQRLNSSKADPPLDRTDIVLAYVNKSHYNSVRTSQRTESFLIRKSNRVTVFRETGGFDCVRNMETDLPYGQNVEVFIVTTSTVTCVTDIL
jgi:hypothetical protein